MKRSFNSVAPAAALSVSILAGCSSGTSEQPAIIEQYYPETADTADTTCSIGIQSKILKHGKIAVQAANGTLAYGKRGAQCETGDTVIGVSAPAKAAFNKQVDKSRKLWLDLADQAIELAIKPTSADELAKNPPTLRYGEFSSIATYVLDTTKGSNDPDNYYISWPDDGSCDYENWGMSVRPLGEVQDPLTDQTLNAFQVMGSSRNSQCDPGDIIIANNDGTSYEFETPHEWVEVLPN